MTQHLKRIQMAKYNNKQINKLSILINTRVNKLLSKALVINEEGRG